MQNIFHAKNATVNDIGYYNYVPTGDLLAMINSKTLHKGVYYEIQPAVTNSPFTGLQASFMFYTAPRGLRLSREVIIHGKDTGEYYRNHFSGTTGKWSGWKQLGSTGTTDTTTLSLLNAKIDTKISKVTPCVDSNLALLDGEGNIKESGCAFSRITNSNQAGQVKARFSGLSASNFTAGTPVRLFIREATSAAVDPAPTTLWPQKAIDSNQNTYETGFFVQGPSEADDRLRENNVLGQVHRWRFAGNYSSKDIGNQGRLRCSITNPDSGFSLSASLILPSGVTGDNITFEFSSIADGASLGTGRGYQLWFDTTFTDPDLTITINSIVRISEAIDPLRV